MSGQTIATSFKLAAIAFCNRCLPFFITRRLPWAAMVNEQRVRSSIKRIFSNSVKEVLGEIFQNSQRAGATCVRLRTTESGFTITDDGEGVRGIQGFHALLKIAESQYAEAAVEQDQRPMGVGLHSLLSFDRVQRVTFTSHELELEIETARWFEDERYYRTWFKRLRRACVNCQGLRITVECQESMVRKLKEALQPKNSYREISPAQGYDGILKIELDDQPVETGLPRWAQVKTVIVETTYLGSRMVIGIGDGSNFMCSTVSWFGQLIPFDFSNDFMIHLEVRDGHPVEPRSPVREGLIENESYQRMIEFAKDALFSYLFAPENRAEVKASWVMGYYRLDRERALLEAPYYVAKPRLALDQPGSVEETDLTGDPEIFLYDAPEQPLLLHDAVVLLQNDEASEHDYGLSSFVKLLPTAYHLECGDPLRLPIATLYWRPGPATRFFFCEPGEFGLSFTDDEPTEYLPVTADHVFVFRQSANWDVEDAEFTASATDQVNFIYTLSWAAFCYEHDEASSDELEDSFEKSIQRMVREIKGNCVSSIFSISDLEPFFQTREARVETIQVLYSEKSSFPESLAVTSNQGETISLSLLH
jgi:hypothetical protein